jgi:hypothetical protein
MFWTIIRFVNVFKLIFFITDEDAKSLHTGRSPLRWASLVSFILAYRYHVRLVMPGKEKQSSLFGTFVKYGCKKFLHWFMS